MASLTQAAFVLVLCLVIPQQHSDFVSGYGYYYVKEAAHVEMHSRKALSEKAGVAAEGQKVEGWELRAVPSGPDPLHHNADPKKPRTP